MAKDEEWLRRSFDALGYEFGIESQHYIAQRRQAFGEGSIRAEACLTQGGIAFLKRQVALIAEEQRPRNPTSPSIGRVKEAFAKR